VAIPLDLSQWGDVSSHSAHAFTTASFNLFPTKSSHTHISSHVAAPADSSTQVYSVCDLWLALHSPHPIQISIAHRPDAPLESEGEHSLSSVVCDREKSDSERAREPANLGTSLPSLGRGYTEAIDPSRSPKPPVLHFSLTKS
jgi:hypothetical protein